MKKVIIKFIRETFLASIFIILATFIAYTLSSCTSTKNIHRSEHDSLAVAKNKVKIDTEDKSKTDTETTTKITEEADGSKTVPGSTVSGSKSISDLQKTPLVLEDGNQQVTVFVDKNGDIEAKGVSKPKTVDFKVNKTTEITQNQQETKSLKQQVDDATQSKAVVKDKEEQKKVVRTFSLPTWIWILILILIILACLYFAIKKKILSLPKVFGKKIIDEVENKI